MAHVLMPTRRLFVTVFAVFGTIFPPLYASGAPQVTLAWRDTSTNESGFTIERKAETESSYTVIGQVAQNITSYTDAGVITGVRYCYRVRAFNVDEVSGYSNEACRAATDPNTPVPLLVSLLGQGAVNSKPAGISCTPTCEKGFPPGTTVVLTAVPKPGWRFQRWGGDCVAKTGTCSFSLSQRKNVTAIFSQTTAVQSTSP